MSQTSDDQLRRAHDLFTRDHDRLRNELMASLPTQAPQPTTAGWARRGWRFIGATKMRRYTAGTVGIAASVFLVVLGLWPGGNGNGRVYGMSDVPNLLKNAKTLHMKGWGFAPDPDKPDTEFVKAEMEHWFDLENGKMSMRKPAGLGGPAGLENQSRETVSDGKYTMETSYRPHVQKPGVWEKMVSFTKLTPFQARLQAHRASHGIFLQMLGNLDQVQGFAKVGTEELRGNQYDVWQGKVAWPSGKATKVKAWLSPHSGELGRVFVWYPSSKNDEAWNPVLDVYLERNVTLPPGIFKTEPPADCTLTNSKEKAPASVLGGEGHMGMTSSCTNHIHIGFTLEDGSVIIGWSSRDKNVDSQADLFKRLKVGGELPKLPAEIKALAPIPPQEKISYSGRHLAYTKKKDKFYEWSIYVPNRKAPTRGSIFAYDVRLKFNKAKKKFDGWPNQLTEDLAIETEEDFRTWVRGAMAELSDNGKVPANVTYERVMKLSEKLRKSLAAKIPNPRN